ncbi:MAG: diacylglycerol kinase family protein [Bacillota bacterium]|nr:diacylglycerol kinase family protein [Bacillota bacterium]HHT90177.1 diacylglycerol kinase family protein [Bacillota bacterium]
MKQRRLYDSVKDAVRGIVYVLRSEKNMRIHIALGLAVIVLAIVLDVPRLELMILILTIGIMYVAELVNTALEEVVNLITRDYHPLAGVVKNIAAGSVLVAALTALCIGYLVFKGYFMP